MWGSGFILTQINCAFSQMRTHTHTHNHPHCSKNVDSSGSEQTEMIRDEDNDLLTETGGGGGGGGGSSCWGLLKLWQSRDGVVYSGMWVWVGGWGSRFILVKLQLLHSAMQRFQSANFMRELLLSITQSLNAFLIYTSVKFLPRGIPQNTCSRRYRKSCGYKARNRTAQQMHLYTSLYIKVLLSKPFVLGFCWSGLCKVVQQAKQCGQEDEFNIMLHNSVLPSCLQLKRILLFGRLLFVFIV